MFYNNPNVEKVGHKVYIYRNFVPESKMLEINKVLKTINVDDLRVDTSDHTIDWYYDKFTKHIPELYGVWQDINELLLPEYCIHPCLTLISTKKGEEMYAHSDSPGEDMEEELIASDMWKTCCVIHYGAIVYFGEFEGGEVYYPNLDSNGEFIEGRGPFEDGNEFKIKPNAGDLIIHGAHSDTYHGVKEITSGVRYAFSTFVLPVEKNPGTFPIYGTKENEERWDKGPGEWLTPIGFEWKPSEKLQKEIDSGVTGVRYRDL
jgi:hypothetical protein